MDLARSSWDDEEPDLEGFMRSAWVLLLLVALGVAAWILVGRAGLQPPGMINGSREAGGRPEPVGGLTANRQAEAESDARRPLEPIAPTEPEVDFLPVPEGGWLVEVVRPKEEAEEETLPVPFASVCFLCRNRVEDYNGFLASRQGWFQRDLPLDDSYLKYGSCYRADAQGRVRVPAPVDIGVKVIGWHGDLWGCTTLPVDGVPPFRLVLRPEVGLEIQVVDSIGRPQSGVPVCLARQTQIGSFRQSPARRTHGPAGTAKFQRVRALIKSWGLKDGAPLYAQIDLPFPSPVVQALDPARLPSEPVRLVLPPTGSVVVQVDGMDDFPKGAQARVQIQSIDPARRGGMGGIGWNGEGFEVTAGMARIPWVGLGLYLELTLFLDLPGSGSLANPALQDGPGPVATGQEVRFHFTALPPTTSPLLAGRALDAQGRPLRSRILHFSFRLESSDKNRPSWSPQYTHRTDGEGRFLVVLPTYIRGDSLACLRIATGQGLPGPVLEGILELHGDLEPERCQVGDVVLHPAHLLVAGSVVDQEGKPLPGVVVSLYRPEPLAPKQQKPTTSDCLSQLTLVTDREGRFRCSASLDLDEVRLWVEKVDFLPTTEIVPTGSSEVKLVLRQAGSLEGNLLVPPGIQPWDLGLQLLYPDRPEKEGRHLSIVSQGWLLARSLEPGLVKLEIRLPRTKELLYEVPGIVVEAGRTCRDPRLKDLDLRGLMQVIDLAVVDEDGAAIASGGVFRTSDRIQLAPIIDGRIHLAVLLGSLDLTIVTGEHEEIRLQNVQGLKRVVLRSGLEILLEVRPIPGPLGEGTRLSVIPVRVEPKAFGVFASKELDAAGRVRIKVPGPGTYRLRWSLRGPIGNRWTLGSEPHEIVVAPGPRQQVFAVPLDPEALRRALERLEGK